MKDTRLRRWKAPGGRWELLFNADQGHVTDLEGRACLDAAVRSDVHLPCPTVP